jgi:alpha-L-fucosidase 2
MLSSDGFSLPDLFDSHFAGNPYAINNQFINTTAMNLCKVLFFTMLFGIFLSCDQQEEKFSLSHNDMVFNELATSWDEAVPLGNAMIGSLVWEKEGKLRFSLDRADLWDLRPVENLSKPEFSYQWVQEQVKNNNYKAVQEMFDVPYDRMPAPSKIPGAALEFDISSLGKVKNVRLDIAAATCRVEWENGTLLETFVHAGDQAGWFRFSKVPAGFLPLIIPPAYQKKMESGVESPVTGQDLQRLGYEQGEVKSDGNTQVYRQTGWNGFEYEVAVAWETRNESLTGVWSISSTFSETGGEERAGKLVAAKIKEENFNDSFALHRQWWETFWSKSSVSLPDSLLEKQYYLEMYKLGAAARPDAPPISLQAVWTADNGKLPPWKGDFHHDLNTQLSYWPAYTGNHLDLEIGFINWMWEYKNTFEEYTKTYFGTSGLNVPGVTTLTGQPMGGWIQYSFGPTVASWLAHHFYLHWIYSGDKEFLKERAYPWLREVAVYLDEISVRDDQGLRKLPISSSPEIHNNSINAWFSSTTNFDLAFIRWNFDKAAELADAIGDKEEALKWRNILGEWPAFALDSLNGLAFAPGHPYVESHRHFSHLVGWHPLGIIDWSNGEKEQEIIRSTLATLESVGSDYWTGYSFSWLGNLHARAFEGEKAAHALRLFAECFCLKNSFHVNGDQCKAGHSKFTYRPFTLEGNFAFASGIQDMLLQSHTGIVRVFPAIPAAWQDVSFQKLRTVGAFLISSEKLKGQVTRVEILSEKGGTIRMADPFSGKEFKTLEKKPGIRVLDGIIEIDTNPGELIELVPA